MGYDLHITRAEEWSDNESAPIPAEEWLLIVDEDPELRLVEANGPYFAVWRSPATGAEDDWLDWFEGNVYSKNPCDALIDKMVQIAGRHGAKVQGEEGEVYTGGGRGGVAPPAPPPRARSATPWWKRLFGGGAPPPQPAPASPSPPETPAFRVGERVRAVWGAEGTVTAVDPQAEHGLGIVTVRFDHGAEARLSLIASGLERFEGGE